MREDRKGIDLDALKAKNLPHLAYTDLLEVKEGETLSEADAKALTDYFARFVKSDGLCINCGARQGAKDLMDSFLGGARFRWGLAHGEGFCSDCGYPARAYHRDVGPIKFVQLILQYHPDELHERETANET